MKDSRNINRVLDKMGGKQNMVVYMKVPRKEDIYIIGVSDASYKQEDCSIARGIIILGIKHNNMV